MIPRLYINHALAIGESVALNKDQQHYLVKVLRRQNGDEAVVFNEKDGEFMTRLSLSGKKDANLQILSLKRGATTDKAGPWLVFSPLQRSAMEWLIEKATELGVSRFLPTITRFTGPHRVNIERLQTIAREAAEQTERLELPTIDPAIPLSARLENWPADRRLYLCAEFGPSVAIADLLSDKSNQPWKNAALMTGPEGGFAEDELARLSAMPFVTPVGLGPRILRAETAALAALAIYQALAGDGAEKAPRPMISLYNDK